MKVLDPGHSYLLNSLDGDCHQVLTFVKREGAKYPGNVGSHPGTTIQDVLHCLIERITYVDHQIPCDENKEIILMLRLSIWLLEQRAAERHGRSENFGIDEAVDWETCSTCGHVQCHGTCRHDEGEGR